MPELWLSSASFGKGLVVLFLRHHKSWQLFIGGMVLSMCQQVLIKLRIKWADCKTSYTSAPAEKDLDPCSLYFVAAGRILSRGMRQEGLAPVVVS